MVLSDFTPPGCVLLPGLMPRTWLLCCSPSNGHLASTVSRGLYMFSSEMANWPTSKERQWASLTIIHGCFGLTEAFDYMNRKGLWSNLYKIQLSTDIHLNLMFAHDGMQTMILKMLIIESFPVKTSAEQVCGFIYLTTQYRILPPINFP